MVDFTSSPAETNHDAGIDRCRVITRTKLRQGLKTARKHAQEGVGGPHDERTTYGCALDLSTIV